MALLWTDGRKPVRCSTLPVNSLAVYSLGAACVFVCVNVCALHVDVKVAVIRYIFTGFVDQSCFGRHAGVPNFVESSICLLYMKVLC